MQYSTHACKVTTKYSQSLFLLDTVMNMCDMWSISFVLMFENVEGLPCILSNQGYIIL